MVELDDSESDSESSEEDSSEDSVSSETDEEEEEEKLKLPGDCKRKRRANIEVLDKEGV